ncbi:hypothetical protein [Streptomyces sp. NPDC102264]|uniref:hypothetical protein n=1 Tax=Streptomyces sp. NPDC102264 TaxID=3366149 RepID=UPI00382AFF74
MKAVARLDAYRLSKRGTHGGGLPRSSRMGSAVFVVAIGIAAVICIILLDRALLWAERREWIYYRKTKGRSAVLVEEFSPAAQAVKRAMEQERLRKNVRPAEGPPLGVDSENRVARIHLRKNTEGDSPS